MRLLSTRRAASAAINANLALTVGLIPISSHTQQLTRGKHTAEWHTRVSAVRFFWLPKTKIDAHKVRVQTFCLEVKCLPGLVSCDIRKEIREREEREMPDPEGPGRGNFLPFLQWRVLCLQLVDMCFVLLIEPICVYNEAEQHNGPV